MEILRYARNPRVTLTLALGTLGGLVLVAFGALAGVGIEILVPYSLLILGTGVVLRQERIASYWARFAVSSGSILLSSLIFYLALISSPATGPLSPLGHAWRLGVICLVTAALSLPIARLAGQPDAKRGGAEPVSL